jgi:hypothetical protein
VTSLFAWCIAIVAGLLVGEGTFNCNKRRDLYLDMHACLKVKRARFPTDFFFGRGEARKPPCGPGTPLDE